MKDKNWTRIELNYDERPCHALGKKKFLPIQTPTRLGACQNLARR